MSASPRRRDLVAVDEVAIVSEYRAGSSVESPCKRHDVGLTRLYRILDRHFVERRQPNSKRIAARVRDRIADDYRRGDLVDEIARRHGVSSSTVSTVAAKAGISRLPRRDHGLIVELVAVWFLGGTLTEEQRDSIVRAGVRHTAPGLRSLGGLDPAVAGEVRQRIWDGLRPCVPIKATTPASS